MSDENQYLSNLVIKSVIVQGFRGRKEEIAFDLRRQANFLIGRNGTGKTTLINLVSDVLSCRYQKIMTSPFTSIVIHFAHSDSRHKPFLEVKKLYDDEESVYGLSVSFTDYKTKGPSFEYQIKSRYYRRNEDMLNSSIQRRIREEFSKRFSVTWLALNRSSGLSRGENSHLSDLDLKLEHSIAQLATWFTRLDSRFAKELVDFQQEWFLSLLIPPTRSDFATDIKLIDLDEETTQIREMLLGIGIKESQFSSKVERHISAAKKINRINFDGDESALFTHILDSYDIARLHHWVDRWKDLQATKKSIYKSKELFIKIANELFYQKEIIVDSGNRLLVKKLDSKSNAHQNSLEIGLHNDNIKMGDLSSGEKQLLIFIIETILKSDDTYIFIADEPELSLHIEWQEKLVGIILQLSPMAQVFFATHSPDIVGPFGDCVFSMEMLAG